MSDRLRGMVLAAGYGTRLAPVTDQVPKPLLTVGNATLLDRALRTLATAGCGAAAVNTHHLGGMIAAHLAAAQTPLPVRLFPEAEILGTGGALHGARDFLAGAPDFLLHNGDVLWTGTVRDLVDRHRQSGALATLLLTDWPAVNTVAVAGDGAVLSLRGQGPETASRLTYTGIGVFARAILDDIPAGFSSLVDPLERALQAVPGSVQGVALPGGEWSDLGTPGRYLSALGTEPETAGPLQVVPLAGQGSDRRFWRLQAGSWSAVAMLDAPEGEEFAPQVAITEALNEAQLGAAKLLAVDEPGRALVMEDLGREDLWTAAAGLCEAPDLWIELYGPVVDHLVLLQKAGEGALGRVPAVRERILGYEELRGETAYFRERFLHGHLGLPPQETDGLEGEFEDLARAVATQPVVVIHRDFQSRNIMLKEGRVRLVDVQGLRRGPLLYDPASLLWDPYVRMPEPARRALGDRFAAAVDDGGLTPSRVRAMFLAAALQRLMQALGAFGFLGHVKGKREFLKHIPRALAHLQLALDELAGMSDDDAGGRFLPGPLPGLTTLVDRAVRQCGPEVTDE